MRFFEGEFQFL